MNQNQEQFDTREPSFLNKYNTMAPTNAATKPAIDEKWNVPSQETPKMKVKAQTLLLPPQQRDATPKISFTEFDEVCEDEFDPK